MFSRVLGGNGLDNGFLVGFNGFLIGSNRFWIGFEWVLMGSDGLLYLMWILQLIIDHYFILLLILSSALSILLN
jgi:hypothetical protein